MTRSINNFSKKNVTSLRIIGANCNTGRIMMKNCYHLKKTNPLF